MFSLIPKVWSVARCEQLLLLPMYAAGYPLLYINVELKSSLGLKKLHVYFEMFVTTVECRKNKNYF